jgi:hypothetical protein
MKEGTKLYTEKYIITIESILGNGMVDITFDNRNGRESNFNTVSERMIEDMISQKEWYIDNDPFKD